MYICILYTIYYEYYLVYYILYTIYFAPLKIAAVEPALLPPFVLAGLLVCLKSYYTNTILILY